MLEVAYICNRRKCEKCNYDECHHTFDYNYALHKDTLPDISKLFGSKSNIRHHIIFEKEEKDG